MGIVGWTGGDVETEEEICKVIMNPFCRPPPSKEEREVHLPLSGKLC